MYHLFGPINLHASCSTVSANRRLPHSREPSQKTRVWCCSINSLWRCPDWQSAHPDQHWRGSTVVFAEIPVASPDKVAEAKKELVIETNEATVSLDNQALAAIVQAAGTNPAITIEVKQVPETALSTTQQNAVKAMDVKAVISAEIL